MIKIARRKFLHSTSGAASAALLASLTGKHDAEAATTGTGTIVDVEHVIILMQENRSFDHYFGTLRGVRGFADNSAILISGLNSVFNQPNGRKRQYPFPLRG